MNQYTETPGEEASRRYD